MGYDMEWRTLPPDIAALEEEIERRIRALVRTPDAHDDGVWPLLRRSSEAKHRVDAHFSRSYTSFGTWFRPEMERAGVFIDLDRDRLPDAPAMPEPHQFGLLDYPDEYDEGPAVDAFRAARHRWLIWKPELPGIPAWKFSSSDGWIVTAGEVREALERLPTQPTCPDLKQVHWDEWLRFLRGAAEHDGFTVN